MAPQTPARAGDAPRAGADPRAEAVGLVEHGLRACHAYAREDLAARLSASQRDLSDPAVHVVVVGEFKQGKSSLVNALIGGHACPVDDDIATALPTYLQHGAPASAQLLFAGDPPRREPVGLDEVRGWVVEGAPAADEATGPAGVEIRLPSSLLAGGLVLVDTPGVGGLGSAHAAASLAAASLADAVLFVTDAAQELTSSEQEFLRRAREMCPTVACVLTKTDLYPSWRAIAERNRRHLTDQAATPVLPVSAVLRTRALAIQDRELNAESGFPPLLAFLRQQVEGEAAARQARAGAGAVLAVCEQLAAQLGGQRAALVDPAAAARTVEQLTAVKERVSALSSAAAKWSQTLSDGAADLSSDVDHDLRHRIREVTSEADREIEQADPAEAWPQLQSWLESRVASEMLSNYALLRERATALSGQVAAHFQEAAGEALTQFPVGNPAPLATSVQVEHQIDLQKMTLGKQAMVALKAAYGGAIMFVMIGLMTGITLGPLALGIGVIMGRKGLREEKRRQLEARRTQAKNAVRRYCDQVSFVMGKDSRDTLRRIQRELRDHYTGLAEQLTRSNQEALRAATEASNRGQQDRAQRLRDLDAELARVAQLQQRADALVATLEPQ